jgi:exonuclease SbcD
MLIVHTADVHIGVENYGFPDPETRTSTRLTDFLNSLDEVVNYAINNKADLVLFCGDAYKSRNPSQTHQREFAKRISILTKNGIPVFLLAGNHDSPNIRMQATALDIFATLNAPKVYVGDKLRTHIVETKSGPIQIISLPWIRKGDFITSKDTKGLSNTDINKAIQETLTSIINSEIQNLNPNIPAVLAGHVSIDSAKTSSEKSMMLGKDYILLKSSINNKKLDYVALGHIHKHQILNENPKIVYPGSLERVDFGEEKDQKGFCVIELDPTVKPGSREVSFNFIPVKARRFTTIRTVIKNTDLSPTQTVINEIKKHDISECIVQIIIDIPANKINDIDEKMIRESLVPAHFIGAINKNIIGQNRIRINKPLSENITPMEALGAYLEERDIDKTLKEQLVQRAEGIINESSFNEKELL